jgi:hypothetical protein
MNSDLEECGGRPNQAKSTGSRGSRSAARRLGLKGVYTAGKVWKLGKFIPIQLDLQSHDQKLRALQSLDKICLD